MQAAVEAFAEKNAGIDFDGAEPGEPLPVQDECRGNSFFLVPLDVDGDYAGVVLMKEVGDHEVRRSVVRPGLGAYTQQPDAAQPDLAPPEFEQAYLTEAQAVGFAEQEGYTPEGSGALTIACAGSYPLAPPTAPFYSFATSAGRVLVSSVTGDVVTEEEVAAFQAANDQLAASIGPTEIEE